MIVELIDDFFTEYPPAPGIFAVKCGLI